MDERQAARLLELPKLPPSSVDEFDTDIKVVVRTLNNTAASKLLGKDLGQSLFDLLALPQNTLPYLYTLVAAIDSQRGLAIPSALWDRLIVFIQSFDRFQVRYAGREFKRLLDTLMNLGYTSPQRAFAISAVQQALLRLDESGFTLHSLQIDFVKLCLATRAFDEALPILAKDQFHIALQKSLPEERLNSPLCSSRNPSFTFMTVEHGFSQPVRYQDALNYYLKGGVILAALNRFARAMIFFELVMSLETAKGSSKMQVEAYKHWICVSLLEHGKLMPLPQGISSQVSKQLHAIAKPYEGLAQAFKDPQPYKLMQEVVSGRDIWQSDGVTGLVHQLVDAYQVFAVSSLSSIYQSLSIRTMQGLAFPSIITTTQVLNYVSGLISGGKLSASIGQSSTSDPGDAMFRFLPEARPPIAQEMATVEAKKKALLEIQQEIRAKNHALQTQKPYVDAMAKQKNAKESKGNASTPGPSDWGVNEEIFETNL